MSSTTYGYVYKFVYNALLAFLKDFHLEELIYLWKFCNIEKSPQFSEKH